MHGRLSSDATALDGTIDFSLATSSEYVDALKIIMQGAQKIGWPEFIKILFITTKTFYTFSFFFLCFSILCCVSFECVTWEIHGHYHYYRFSRAPFEPVIERDTDY